MLCSDKFREKLDSDLFELLQMCLIEDDEKRCDLIYLKVQVQSIRLRGASRIQ